MDAGAMKEASQTRIRVGVRVLIFVAIGSAIGAAWFYAVFVRGRHEIDRPGGHWTLESVHYPDSHSVSSRLYYESEGHRAIVADLVHQYRYYGNDCIAYGTGGEGRELYFVVCGDRAP